ncbi:MAG: cohesin domain-containing protein [Candidatus Poribacteria bacterium]|nr:cohesin domain-containing protein [Candidatus Poribacteria bacterium]
MTDQKIFIILTCLLMLGTNYQNVDAQENLAQSAYAIFQQNCLNCHGAHGAFTEEIIIEHSVLIETGAVVPGQPIASELYKRLLTNDPAKRMPLGQPQLPAAAILTIENWIKAGAPDWDIQHDVNFITPHAMLTAIEKHLSTLDTFNRPFARYFTMTHLYNAGERPETLRAYRVALSKLVNSLSWGYEVINPKPIDAQATIFYIDLRDYEWDIRGEAWRQIESIYPYAVEYAAEKQSALLAKLTKLRQEMDCDVPFIHVDWFLATASLPPLYHEILDLPETDLQLERQLGINVARNLNSAPGVRVWRAGFNDSGVSNHNRVVERHKSQHGAYWKSYDFAGSAGVQNIFTHPLSFRADGGEIVFNLPNGLQAYYISNALGQRIAVAPTDIVSNPAASDPAVHNGLSCIGCHTEGMKAFEDTVRAAVQQTANPPFDKAHALRLYVPQTVMDALVAEDTQRYRKALEATGGVFGGIEPVHRFYEVFHGPVDAEHAAASVGLEKDAFLKQIREKSTLQNLGLTGLLSGGNVKRDAWTARFSEVISALNLPDTSVTPVIVRPVRPTPGETVHIPDPNLRAVIEDALGKAPGALITVEEMATLEQLRAENKNINDLTGLAFAKNLTVLDIAHNPLSDLSHLALLTKLRELYFHDTEVADLSPLSGLHALEVLNASATRIRSLAPLAGLKNLQRLDTVHSDITDLSPLSGLTNLTRLRLYDVKATDITPLKGLTKLKWLGLTHTDNLSDLSPLSGLTGLEHLALSDTEISDISALSGLVGLKTLILNQNRIADVSPLASLRNLNNLQLHNNNISDFSPLDGIRQNIEVFTWFNNPGFPQGGPNIEGPWLWLTLPIETDKDGTLTDYLAKASKNKSTEQRIATLGSSEGTVIGNSVWTVGILEPYEPNNFRGNRMNLRRLLDSQGAIEPNIHGQRFVVYGSMTLYSPRTQKTKIFIGASNDQKVYLNGTLVHEDYTDYAFGEHNAGYRTFFPITLQKGKNVLLVRLDELETREELWSLFFGFEPGTEYTVANPSIGYTFSTPKIHVGDTFTLDLRAEDIYDLAGWQFDIAFDPTVLEAIEVNEGDFLKTKGDTTFFQKGKIDNRDGKITGLSSALLSGGGVTGTGTLLSVNFSAKAGGETQLKLQNVQFGSSTGSLISAGPREVTIVVEGQLATGDVNRDGQVSILDMILIAQQLGKTVPPHSAVDVNGDGTISILDMILVAQHLGESTGAAAPSLLAMNGIAGLDPAMIQAWIKQAHLEDDGSIAFRQGIAYLQSLLALLIPEETRLLPNYPNPFNPETWIPYQLSEPVEVTVTIHTVNGVLVRTLVLGHTPAGIYQSRSRAAYWDGRNEVGEPVASGLYFYTLTADDFTATRKMLIRK